MKHKMPFFRFPFPYNHAYYNRFSNYYPNMYNRYNNLSSKLSNVDKSYSNASNNSTNLDSSLNTNKVHSENKFEDLKKSEDNCFFELFGLKLFFDDVLLICIIFFLYQEGTRDNELFLSLILLLLS